MPELDEIVKEFLVESHENLDQLDRDLVTLEQDPGSRDTLSSIFRTIHTIKGTCGFLGFGKLESVAHVGENLLSKVRDGELALDPPITTGLLSLVDAVREILGNIESLGSEGEAEYSELIEALIGLQESRLTGSGELPAAENNAARPPSPPFCPPPSAPNNSWKKRLSNGSSSLAATIGS